jgi:hypothetical protein
MSALSDLFDTYGRNARLYPALLVMVPLLALPSVLENIQKASRVAVIAVLGVAMLYVLAHVVRALGKRAEKRLLARWGGLPTTRWLLWSDTTLDPTSKKRYRDYLASKGLQMPSPQDEITNPHGTRERLASAVTWLRNNRRGDAYRILHAENAAYGFRRNLYGSKVLGMSLAAICACVDVGFASVALPRPIPLMGAFAAVAPEIRVGLLVALVWLVAWMFVTPAWVRESAELYAKALLETCDAPSF